MATWKGKTRGGLAGYRFFIFLLKYPGIRFSYFFLRFVVLYYVIFVPSARKPIFNYFHTILEFNYLKSVRYVFLNFYRLGQVLLDKVALLAGFSKKFTFDLVGEEYIQQMAESGGGFLIGGHIGNWEIAGQSLQRINTTVHILMLEAEHERIKVLLDQVMKHKSMHIISIKDDFSHLFLIKEALQRGEIIAMHGDRFIAGSPTINGNLFGHPARFPYGPFFLPLKFEKPVAFVSAVKASATHYQLNATRPVVFAPGRNKDEREKKIHEMLDLYIQEMERVLKIYPEQWFNYYYFWSDDKPV